jgi:GST-like protein
VPYVLYGDKGTGAFCVEAALAEACANYEFAIVSLRENEQTHAPYLAINLSGKVPALKLPSGQIVTESAGLLLTIADRHPEANLLPPVGTPARADFFHWLAFMASEIYLMVDITDYPGRFVPEGDEANALRLKAAERVRGRLLIIEDNVAGPWLLASGFSAADNYAAMFTRWRDTIGED